MIKITLLFSLSIMTNLYASSSHDAQSKVLNEKKLFKKASRAFKPIKKYSPKNENKVQTQRIALGKKLFFETALSSNNKMSCNTCHNLKTFGVDNQATSLGVKGQRGGRNSPTVYNAFMHDTQFWDGREPDVEAQAIGPILNPVEMNMPSAKAVMKKIRSRDNYPKLFKSSFPGDKKPFTYKNLGRAIGAFERTLSTPSRFDQYLNGDKSALNQNEKKGLQTFMKVGCATCHRGKALGGDSFRKIGEVNPYKTQDKGRFEVTKNKEDLYFFKVPSLRNIEKTAPYFHDGSVKTLKSAIKLMSYHQLGTKLNDNEVKLIESFLISLTAKIK